MKVIPINPKVKIKNFLYKLDDKIKIIKKNNKLEILHNKTGKSYNSIAKEVGISESYYRRCIKVKKNLPIWFLKFLLKLDKNILNKYYKKSLKYTARSKIVRLPKELTPKLAYFIGYLQGDGFIGSDKKTYGFSDEYLEHLNYLNKINKELFENRGYIRIKKSRISKKDTFHLEIRQYVVNSYLHHVWGIPRGFKNKLRIPKEFYKHKEILRWYLMGLFDADGTLPKHPKKAKQLFIDIAMKDKYFVNEIKKILKSKFGIRTLKLYPKISKSPSSNTICITWELRIRKRSELKKFLKEISFHHFNKCKRVNEMLKLLPE